MFQSFINVPCSWDKFCQKARFEIATRDESFPVFWNEIQGFQNLERSTKSFLGPTFGTPEVELRNLRSNKLIPLLFKLILFPGTHDVRRRNARVAQPRSDPTTAHSSYGSACDLAAILEVPWQLFCCPYPVRRRAAILAAPTARLRLIPIRS